MACTTVLCGVGAGPLREGPCTSLHAVLYLLPASSKQGHTAMTGVRACTPVITCADPCRQALHDKSARVYTHKFTERQCMYACVLLYVRTHCCHLHQLSGKAQGWLQSLAPPLEPCHVVGSQSAAVGVSRLRCLCLHSVHNLSCGVRQSLIAFETQFELASLLQAQMITQVGSAVRQAMRSEIAHDLKTPSFSSDRVTDRMAHTSAQQHAGASAL
jgi:hypothetical protein